MVDRLPSPAYPRLPATTGPVATVPTITFGTMDSAGRFTTGSFLWRKQNLLHEGLGSGNLVCHKMVCGVSAVDGHSPSLGHK